MDFLPDTELWRHVARARRRRVRELVSLGVPRPVAQQQAAKEFSVYDQIEIDDRSWVRIKDFDLAEE